MVLIVSSAFSPLSPTLGLEMEDGGGMELVASGYFMSPGLQLYFFLSGNSRDRSS